MAKPESIPAITEDTSLDTVRRHVEDYHILPGPNHFTRPKKAHERMHTANDGMLPHIHNTD